MHLVVEVFQYIAIVSSAKIESFTRQITCQHSELFQRLTLLGWVFWFHHVHLKELALSLLASLSW